MATHNILLNSSHALLRGGRKNTNLFTTLNIFIFVISTMTDLTKFDINTSRIECFFFCSWKVYFRNK